MGWLGAVALVQAVTRRIGYEWAKNFRMKRKYDVAPIAVACPSPTWMGSTCSHVKREDSSPLVRATLGESLPTGASKATGCRHGATSECPASVSVASGRSLW